MLAKVDIALGMGWKPPCGSLCRQQLLLRGSQLLCTTRTAGTSAIAPRLGDKRTSNAPWSLRYEPAQPVEGAVTRADYAKPCQRSSVSRGRAGYLFLTIGKW